MPAVEALDRRVLMAVTASFAGGTLFVTGDAQDNVITISRTAGGTILVNNGAIPIQGVTVADTNHLHLVGGDGNDTISLDETNGPLPGAALFGGTGDDTLTGGSGIDFADGEAGNDFVSLGGGDDDFQWNPGDGSDVVDAGAGNDAIIFNGNDADEKFDLSDSGKGSPFHDLLLSRDVGNVVMDLESFEALSLNTFGGADSITVNDQSATGLQSVNLDLEGSRGPGGDGQVDAVILNGTDADDIGQVQASAAQISVNVSSFPVVNITGSEAGNDSLTLNALGGNDKLDISAPAADLIKLSVDGGTGNDLVRLIGTAAADDVIYNAGSVSVGGSAIALTSVETRTFDGNGGGDHLTINGGAVALGSTQKIASLAISAGAVLDIGDHSLIVDYTGASPLAGVTGLIKSGGIASSSDTTTLTGIGVAEASDVARSGTFAGQSVDATAVLVKFTYSGDANLDGVIDIDDFVRIDTGIAVKATGWSNGDFNLDGTINIDDYVIIDDNIRNQGPPILSASDAEPAATPLTLRTLPKAKAPITPSMVLAARPPSMAWGNARGIKKAADELIA